MDVRPRRSSGFRGSVARRVRSARGRSDRLCTSCQPWHRSAARRGCSSPQGRGCVPRATRRRGPGGNHAHILARRPCPAGRPHQPAPRCHARRPGAAVRRGQAPPLQDRLRQLGAVRVLPRAARGDGRPRGGGHRLPARTDEHRNEGVRDERRPLQRRERDRLRREPHRGQGCQLGLRPRRDARDRRPLQRGRRHLEGHLRELPPHAGREDPPRRSASARSRARCSRPS